MDLLRKKAFDEVMCILFDEEDRIAGNFETEFPQLEDSLSVLLTWNGIDDEHFCGNARPYEPTCKYLVAKVDKYNYMLICCPPDEKPNKAFDLLHNVGRGGYNRGEMYGSGDSIKDKLYKGEIKDSDGGSHTEVLYELAAPKLYWSYEQASHPQGMPETLFDTRPMIEDSEFDDSYIFAYREECYDAFNRFLAEPERYSDVAFKISGTVPCLICTGNFTEYEKKIIEKCWSNTQKISMLIETIKSQGVLQKSKTQHLIGEILTSTSDMLVRLLAKMSVRTFKKDIRELKLALISAQEELNECIDRQEKLKTVHKKLVIRGFGAISMKKAIQLANNSQLDADKRSVKIEIERKKNEIKQLKEDLEKEVKEIAKVVRLLQGSDVIEEGEIEQLSNVYSECEDLQ